MARHQSTPEQIEAAILTGSTNPCRYTYAAEVWDQADPERWEQTVPPHAVIHGLRRDRDHYAELLRTKRLEVAKLKTELAAIRSALRTLHQAVDINALFDLEAES